MNEFVKLSDLCILITKGSTPTTYGYSFKNEGIPFIKAEALNGDVSLDVKGFSYIDDETHNFLKRSKIYPNDILMTIAGANIGKTGFVRENISEANTNQAVAIIRLDKEKVCPQFYYYYFKQKTFFKFVQSLNAQAAQPNINLKMIGDFLVPKLEIDSQLKVVSILGTIDDLYLCNLDRITKSKQIILNLYQEWFINFKFPNYEQVEFVDGIPEGWELKSVSELTQLISRGITPKYNDESGKSIVINQKCIRDNKLNLELARRQDKEIPDSKLVQKGDVLINSTGAGTLGRVTQVHEDLPDTTVDTHVTIARPLQEISSAWFGAAISHIESYIETLGEGATNQLELKREVIGRIDLVCPAMDIQNQFQKIVEPMQQQILNLIKQNTHLLKLKETLLPRLMSGELDVSKLSTIE
ncbi:restriction endonuclease subunit S [Moraxella osloensis]|uniref:restriction endonuclease subunit S n=1 Tax=Faucicola osloensis TaxID=34062 RepID=UPI002005A727|nr:restriction endonuclease subunit S [Moraxella osloensis]MCK6053629.1 restriction endonuclease subunit S [Moraxella osloensis]